MRVKHDFPEEFLSGYIDRELTDKEMAQIETALAEDGELRESYHSLRASNQQFGKHLRDSIPAEPLNLWVGIQQRIAPRPVPAEPWAGSVFGALRELFSRPAGLAIAGAFGVAMFALGLVSSRVTGPSEIDAIAKNKVNSAEVLVPLVGDSRQLTGEVRYVSRNSPVAGFSPRFVSPQTLREDHPARNAGYSTDTVHIEWMKCPKNVKIVRPENLTELPPVLWIGDGE